MKPALFAAAGFAAIALVLVAGSSLEPSVQAGIVFLLTIGLICLACVGACLGTGRHREIWLGAAILALVSWLRHSPDRPLPKDGRATPPSSCSTPSARGLAIVRAWAPPPSRAVAALNARIFQALEQPVTMRFDGESLEGMIKYIQYATQGPDVLGALLTISGRSIPF